LVALLRFSVGRSRSKKTKIKTHSLPGQAIAINQLLENFKEEALSHDCDCPQCKQIKESFIDVEPPSTKQNNEKKLDALLKDFLRGEL